MCLGERPTALHSHCLPLNKRTLDHERYCLPWVTCLICLFAYLFPFFFSFWVYTSQLGEEAALETLPCSLELTILNAHPRLDAVVVFNMLNAPGDNVPPSSRHLSSNLFFSFQKALNMPPKARLSWSRNAYDISHEYDSLMGHVLLRPTHRHTISNSQPARSPKGGGRGKGKGQKQGTLRAPPPPPPKHWFGPS